MDYIDLSGGSFILSTESRPNSEERFIFEISGREVKLTANQIIELKQELETFLFDIED